MKGKVVVITGASRGIGRETAKELAKRGATLVLVVRDGARGREVADAIGGAEVVVADLSSMAEVRRAAAEILAKHDRIDVLINNAGALLMERHLTKDGYEATFATNHLAYFLLTKLLLPALERAEAARIVNVASEAHKSGNIDFDDLMGEKRWAGWRAYGQSKLANILFTNELARRLAGTKVTANSLHPGAIASNFGRDNPVYGFFFKLAAPFLKTSEEGARTTIYLATSPDVAGVSGKYFKNEKEAKPRRVALNESVAKRLWDVSEALAPEKA